MTAWEIDRGVYGCSISGRVLFRRAFERAMAFCWVGLIISRYMVHNTRGDSLASRGGKDSAGMENTY